MIKTRAITERDHIPPPANCHRAGFGLRMENGLVGVHVAPNKSVYTDRWMDGQTNMKIAYAQLYMYTNIMYRFHSNTYKTVGEKLLTKLCPRTDGHENCICTTSYTNKHYV